MSGQILLCIKNGHEILNKLFAHFPQTLTLTETLVLHQRSPSRWDSIRLTGNTHLGREDPEKSSHANEFFEMSDPSLGTKMQTESLTSYFTTF